VLGRGEHQLLVLCGGQRAAQRLGLLLGARRRAWSRLELRLVTARLRLGLRARVGVGVRPRVGG
jgi:hypothetical protein